MLKLVIKNKALLKMRKHSPASKSGEAGGILLGHVYEAKHVITDVTEPNKYDISKLFGFTRSAKPAQKNINKAWRQSNGIQIYLGEWHSHHELNPTPSGTDIASMKKAVRETLMEIPFLYQVIYGIKDTFWVGCFFADKIITLRPNKLSEDEVVFIES